MGWMSMDSKDRAKEQAERCQESISVRALGNHGPPAFVKPRVPMAVLVVRG